MNNKAMALSVFFFEEIKRLEKGLDGKISTNVSYKYKVMSDFLEILNSGISYEQLMKVMQEFLTVKNIDITQTYLPSDILNYFSIPFKRMPLKNDSQHSLQIPGNLIQSNRFYYHHSLQITPPPPRVIQLKTGEFISEYEDFYLEIREFFSISDLVNYFYEKYQITERNNYDRDIGAFTHMLKNNDLDFLLHLIDESYAQSLDRGVNISHEPFAIQNYYEEAKVIYENRKNTCFEGGFDHVIPRKRFK